MFFHPKNLKSENNNPWFKPWFDILLHTQSIVSATVDSQCLKYLGYITLTSGLFVYKEFFKVQLIRELINHVLLYTGIKRPGALANSSTCQNFAWGGYQKLRLENGPWNFWGYGT